MPSIRKRIGYLPTQIVQQLVNEIANNEKISQSKVVGILVEEALSARGLIDKITSNKINRKYLNRKDRNINNISLKYYDLDEMISDNGITYNKKEYKEYKNSAEEILTESSKEYNETLFEDFKKFLLFKKMLDKE